MRRPRASVVTGVRKWVQTACYGQGMARIIQVRDVADDVHGVLAARARAQGMSLSEYLRGELARMASRPSVDEWLGRLRQTEPMESPLASDELVRRARRAA